MPYRDNLWAYHKYAVVKDINNVTTSTIESTFNMLGMGIQIEMPSLIKRLVKVEGDIIMDKKEFIKIMKKMHVPIA